MTKAGMRRLEKFCDFMGALSLFGWGVFVGMIIK